MNFWTPQTGKMGDGWAYTYGAHQVRGFKQTHQPSPWINDYGQFSLMPVRGEDKFDEESRASWFSHQSEVAKPYYYKTYLADHDIRVEITPTDRAAMMRFTFPDSKESGVVIDAFDRGSQVGMVDDRTIVGYTTRNSGGVPENFLNWFVVRFDTPFSAIELTDAPADTNPAATCSIPKGRSPSRANMPWPRCISRPAAASRYAPAWRRRSFLPNRRCRTSGNWVATISKR